jgi:predicted acetyltransferase
MASLKIRPYRAQDEEGFFAVISLTYNDGLEVPAERRQYLLSQRYVAEQEGKIVGTFSVLELKLTRGAAEFHAAGVAGVAVSPDARREGVGAAMMNWAVENFRREGKTLAALFPFREPFYARSGYAVAGMRIRLTVPMHRLPRIETDLPIRRLTPADWRELVDCRSRFAHGRSGVNLRTEGMWGRVLSERKPLAIYAAGDPVQGYIAVSHQTTFWEEQFLSEVIWSSRAGYEACLAMMHRVAINKTSVSWYEPSDSPFYSFYLDQGVTAEIQRPTMFRVCDVVAALNGLKPIGSGAFTFGLQDPQIPENDATFQVRFKPERVLVEKTHIDLPDLIFSVPGFTQAFLGEPSLAQLAQFGSVQVNSQSALEEAERLLPPLPVYCNDFF